MRRFLLYFGYKGTRLRGVQKQVGEVGSVHEHLEAALTHLRPANTPALYVSSRTDRGVHAVCNAAHVDLERNKVEYEPHYLTIGLNRYFQKHKVDIRVHQAVHVPDTFHARFCATGRSYLYRVCVVQPWADLTHCTKGNLESLLPIPELHRIYIIRPPFDIGKALEVCELLQGHHDFASFSGKIQGDKTTRRTLDQINVREGLPLLSPEYIPASRDLQYWDVVVHSRSFLYKQVRRMVGVLVAVAKGVVEVDEVRHMLDVPSRQSWPSRAIVAPPHGLYLTKVHYPPEASTFPAESGVRTPESLNTSGDSIEGVHSDPADSLDETH